MKKLLILSGKGGTGKTTTAAAFTAFAGAKAIADCDVDAPNLHLVTKADTSPLRTDYYGSQKATILPEQCNNCGICQAHCRFDAIEQQGTSFAVNQYACEGCGVCLAVCPQKAAVLQEDIAGELALYQGAKVFSTATLRMGRGNTGKLVTAVKSAMSKAAPQASLAIIDGSPGIGCPVIASISGVDLVLIVAEPSLSGLSDLRRIVTTSAIFEAKTAVCINKHDTSPSHTQMIQEFCQQNSIPFTGCIPYDPAASAAINQGKSLAETDCPAGRALRVVYDNTIKLLEG